MPGPSPKDPKLRQRTNKASTAGDLPAEDERWVREREQGKIPPLPNRGRGRAWSERTKTWWADVWTSPMRTKYLRVQLDGLLALAELVDARNKMDANDPHRLRLEAEIRMQRRDYGLTPMDQWRLGWTVDEGPRAATVEEAPAPAVVADDPRHVLRAVK